MTPEDLRAESRRLRDLATRTADPTLKRELAAQALGLAQRAEAVASAEELDIIRANIERYRSMLAVAMREDSVRQTIQQLLTEMESRLAQPLPGTES